MVRIRACAKPDPDAGPNGLSNGGCLSNTGGDAVRNANGDANPESISAPSVSRSNVAIAFSDTVFRSKRKRQPDAGCELYRLAKPKRYRKPVAECQRDADRMGFSREHSDSRPTIKNSRAALARGGDLRQAGIEDLSRCFRVC